MMELQTANPAASSNRGWGLSSALDTAPKQPSQKGRIVNYDGSGSTVDHAVKVEGGQGYFINGDEKTAMDKEREIYLTILLTMMNQIYLSLQEVKETIVSEVLMTLRVWNIIPTHLQTPSIPITMFGILNQDTY